MHKTEDTAHGAWLLNKLIKMWAELLPMQDRQLCFGGKETRLVVSKAIRRVTLDAQKPLIRLVTPWHPL